MLGVGDQFWFVSIVYLGVLLPWGFLYFHDFISARWQTIRSTLRAGILHSVVICVPMPLIIAYIISQQATKEKDNKETYAAITALAVGIFHLMRTIWGMQQLIRFRKWAIETAYALERGSYRCLRQCTPSYTPPTDLARGSSSFSFDHRRRPSSRRPSIAVIPRRIPSSLLRATRPSLRSSAANQGARTANTLAQYIFYPFHYISFRLGLVLNRPILLPLFQGTLNTPPAQTVCLGHQSNVFQNSTSCDDEPSIEHTPGYTDEDIISEERKNEIKEQISHMRVNSSIIDNEFIGSEAPRTRLFRSTFIDPHDAFVRWAICYLAQFGSAWLKASKTRPYDTGTWAGRRYSLAADVWATACLRMETSCILNSHYKGPNQSGILTDNTSQVSFLAPSMWKDIVSGHMDQLFSKDNLIRDCLLSGRGMPYERPIIERNEHLPAPGEYKGLIKDILGDLPAKFYDVVDGISPVQLHWFAIFIWISRWTGCSAVDGSNFSDSSPRSPSLDAFSGSGGSNLNPNHAPVLTLQDQLGIDDELTLDRCSFPFVRQRYGEYLWGNRSVLQVSARIDNWLALRIGRQLEKLSRNDKTFQIMVETAHTVHVTEFPSDIRSQPGVDEDGEPGKTGENEGSSSSPQNDGASSSKSAKNNKSEKRRQKRSQKIFDCHRCLEISRLRYQLARTDVPLHHYDQGITFMGCAMETVRSFLADDVHSNENNPDAIPVDWEPVIAKDEVVRFPISSQLVECMNDIKREGSNRFDSTVRERLLWECQNGLVNIVDDENRKVRSKCIQLQPQLMMLAILSFPGLDFEKVLIQSNNSTADLDQNASRRASTEDQRVDEMERGVSNDGTTSITVNSTTESHATLPEGKVTAAHQESPQYELKFALVAPVAPQPIKVTIGTNVSSPHVCLRLSCDEAVTNFRWQDWRDAFLGRMVGKAEWQCAHFMRNLLVNPTTVPIDYSIKHIPVGESRSIPLWEGWQPFRARIRRFELEHSSLIIVNVNEVHSFGSQFPPSGSADDISQMMGGVLAAGSHDGDSPQPVRRTPVVNQQQHRVEQEKTAESEIPAEVQGAEAQEGQTQTISNESVASSSETKPKSRADWIDISHITNRRLEDVSIVLVGGGRAQQGVDHHNAAYVNASQDELSDASEHVDSVLRLNSTLIDSEGKDSRLKHSTSVNHLYGPSSPRAPDIYAWPKTPLRSPLFSHDNLSLPLGNAEDVPLDEEKNKELVDKVNQQNADAMAKLASLLLRGTAFFRQDRARALGLMERAVALEKNMKTANLFLKEMIGDIMVDSPTHWLATQQLDPSNVRRAIAMVDLLWRDMPTRFSVQGTGRSGRREMIMKNGFNQKEEERRVRQLVDLHKRVIYARRSYEVMTSLADQLVKFGTTKRQIIDAVIMYESAIIAGTDPLAMVGLALLNVDRDEKYATRLFHRARFESSRQSEWTSNPSPSASLQTEIDQMNSPAILDGRGSDVLERLHTFAACGDSRATKLLEKCNEM